MNKIHIDIAGAVLLFFICLFVYTKLAGPIPFAVTSVTTTKTNLFQVTGDGKATAVPNTAHISFGVTKTASTVADAQNQTNTAVNSILNNIKSLGIDTKNITTSNYSVNPNYNYSSGTQTITGYTVTQNIDAKITPIEKAQKALDVVTQSGANIVGGLTFTLDDKTQQDVENKARQQAIDNAKQKAQSLANASGMHLGKIVDVQENVNAIAPRPILMNAAAGMAKLDTAQETQLPTGETTYKTTVTLSYETY